GGSGGGGEGDDDGTGRGGGSGGDGGGGGRGAGGCNDAGDGCGNGNGTAGGAMRSWNLQLFSDVRLDPDESRLPFSAEQLTQVRMPSRHCGPVGTSRPRVSDPVCGGQRPEDDERRGGCDESNGASGDGRTCSGKDRGPGRRRGLGNGGACCGEKRNARGNPWCRRRPGDGDGSRDDSSSDASSGSGARSRRHPGSRSHRSGRGGGGAPRRRRR
ncbi:unnamed protein product, partial [Phaeothamnion confervicola]